VLLCKKKRGGEGGRQTRQVVPPPRARARATTVGGLAQRPPADLLTNRRKRMARSAQAHKSLNCTTVYLLLWQPLGMSSGRLGIGVGGRLVRARGFSSHARQVSVDKGPFECYRPPGVRGFGALWEERSSPNFLCTGMAC
jgi:hypothetical protein